MSENRILKEIDRDVFKQSDMPQHFIEISGIFDLKIVEEDLNEAKEINDAYKKRDWESLRRINNDLKKRKQELEDELSRLKKLYEALKKDNYV